MEEIIATFGIDIRLLLIQMFNFGLLLLILWHFLYKPVIRILEERRKKIEEGINASEQASKQLEEINKSKESLLLEATRDADRVIEKARKFGKEQERELRAIAEEKSTAILTDAMRQAKQIHAKALEDSKAEIAQLAVLGAEKILREKLQ